MQKVAHICGVADSRVYEVASLDLDLAFLGAKSGLTSSFASYVLSCHDIRSDNCAIFQCSLRQISISIETLSSLDQDGSNAMASDEDSPIQEYLLETDDEEEPQNPSVLAARVTAAESAKKNMKRGSNSRGDNYTLTEQLLCCKAFIAASNDMEKGVNQKHKFLEAKMGRCMILQ